MNGRKGFFLLSMKSSLIVAGICIIFLIGMFWYLHNNTSSTIEFCEKKRISRDKCANGVEECYADCLSINSKHFKTEYNYMSGGTFGSSGTTEENCWCRKDNNIKQIW